ncbi:hypothetical protein AURDEDRAFT_123478 [Auricularia subglabra TFB-10046 SS5]|nr:hypothetical protein AURDEDRAFT_123478 [Auricularia subglabra TFB-10046 SS5]
MKSVRRVCACLATSLLSKMSLTIATSNKRHHRYFAQDGNLFITIGETYFCVHASILGQHSGFFKNMLAEGKPLNGEGMSEETPLELPGLTAKQFEMILDIVYFECVPSRIYPGPALSVLEALALLELSDKFDMEKAQRYCLDKLSTRIVPPILRLHYGVKCHLDGWVRSAYEELLIQPIHRIPSAHLVLVDAQLLLDVVRTKARCIDFRRGLYYDPPGAVHAPSCTLNAPCATAWKLSFRAGFCLRYLNPEAEVDDYMSPIGASVVLNETHIPGMMPQCMQLTRASFLGDQGFFMGEERILDQAVQAALGQGSTEPIPTAQEASDWNYFNERR